jgi:hypothetical protein
LRQQDQRQQIQNQLGRNVMSASLRFAVGVTAACLAASGTRAAVFTVGGPQGTSTLEQATSQANALTGTDEIRLHSGTLAAAGQLNLRIEAGNDLAISGGWNDTFTARDPAAGSTQLAFTTPTAVLDVLQTGGNGSILGLALTRSPGSLGRGLQVELSGGQLSIDSCIVSDHTLDEAFALQAGASIGVRGTGRLTLDKSKFLRNRSKGSQVAGSAAAAIGVSDDARVIVSNSVFQNNVAETLSAVFGGIRGATLSVSLGGESGNPRFEFVGNRVVNNSFTSNGTSGTFVDISVSSSGGATGQVILRRDTIQANQSGGRARSQLGISAAKPVDTLITDSVIAKSDAAIGADLQTSDGRFRLVNVTVVDNGGAGGTQLLIIDGAGLSSISNTIALGGTPLLVPNGTQLSNNLLSGDPKFVNRTNGNFHLQSSSSAINAATKTPPLGGLGTKDIDNQARVRGGKVDIGADEF